ncbi:MAG: 1-aminocyclopropane-1-carboxylate deaminase/D-cysteine desulfhydrase, partial [Saprospiraceae bacterium]
MTASLSSPLQLITDHPGTGIGIRLYVKRDDLLHPTVSGNKWRKLEPVVQLINGQQFTGILTFGGPYSNHLQAVAAAGKNYNFPTVGLVRGTAADQANPTLAQAQADGMQLCPIP